MHWVKDLNQRSARIWGNTFIYDRWKKHEEEIKHPLAVRLLLDPLHIDPSIWYSVPLNTEFQRCWHGKTKAFSSAENLSTQHIRQFSFYPSPHPQRIHLWYGIFTFTFTHKKTTIYFGKYTIPMDPIDGIFQT